MNIYDIAKKSGVSIATVSRVINNSEKVSEKTRKKILDVMAEMNYTPNVFARGLGLDTMHMIGLMCTDVSDIHFAKAVSLLEKDLRARSFDTLLCCSGNNLEDKEKTLELLIKKRVDAVILIGSAFAGKENREYIRTAARKIPIFVINGPVDIPNVISVMSDDRKAMYDNVRMLNDAGCKNILYLYDIETYSGSQKKAGYEDGVKEFGLKSIVQKTEKTAADTRLAVKKLLDGGERIDAIIASEDIIAVGALKALADKGIQIPVIGYNNSVLAGSSTPEITSVDNMLDTICPEIANMIEKLGSGETLPEKIVINTRLAVRETFVPKKTENNVEIIKTV